MHLEHRPFDSVNRQLLSEFPFLFNNEVIRDDNDEDFIPDDDYTMSSDTWELDEFETPNGLTIVSVLKVEVIGIKIP